MPRFVKGSKEASEYMKMLRARKGKGIMDVIKKNAKSLVKSGIDVGADYLKN